MKNDSIFTKHPHDAGETYLEHLSFTIYISARMIWGGIAVLIHGLLPFVFTYTGSNTIKSLSEEIHARGARSKAKSAQE